MIPNRYNPFVRLALWRRRTHRSHHWDGRIIKYHTDHASWAGIIWGWGHHRYQQCRRCSKRRLIEGYWMMQTYYLRAGFISEDGTRVGPIQHTDEF